MRVRNKVVKLEKECHDNIEWCYKNFPQLCMKFMPKERKEKLTHKEIRNANNKYVKSAVKSRYMNYVTK